ncbi:MAG: alpha/beta hydrolase [Actinomycetota bacterium]|nr:alpha/beta hydrolase [Actinomycetota bacterium]
MKFEHGMLAQIPFAAHGSGPPLVVLAGLLPVTGVGSSVLIQSATDPVHHLLGTRRFIVLNRRPGLAPDLTMSALASEHAHALRAGFDGPVDVLGSSTGGSIAQQLAADHPDTVRRLCLVSSACRLGPHAKSSQAQLARDLHEHRYRHAVATASKALTPPRAGQHLAAGIGWVTAPRILTSPEQAADLAATLHAEDGFDLATCHDQIQAPTLIIAGARDRFYNQELFAETTQLIPNSHLRIFPHRGHITIALDHTARTEIAHFFTQHQT